MKKLFSFWVMLAFVAASCGPSPLQQKYRVASSHVDAGLYDEALKLLNEVLSENPVYTNALALRARVFLNQGKYELACKDLTLFAEEYQKKPINNLSDQEDLTRALNNKKRACGELLEKYPELLPKK